MRNTIFVLSLIATLGLPASAQDAIVTPSITLNANTQIVSTRPAAVATREHLSYQPPFCPPKTAYTMRATSRARTIRLTPCSTPTTSTARSWVSMGWGETGSGRNRDWSHFCRGP